MHGCILVQSEPLADERLRTLIDDELKLFDVKQGEATKTIEELNKEFLKKNSNSLTHRAEGMYNARQGSLQP